MRFLILSLAVCLLSGCAHKFETAKFNESGWAVDGNGIEGVIYYEPQLVKVTYKYTARIDDKGNIVGTKDGVGDTKCVPITQKEELVVLPNYDEQRVIINRPGWFSTGKLSVNLQNGMLSSVNSESASQAMELIKQVAPLTAAIGALSILPGEAGAGAMKPCNACPEIVNYKKVEISD